MNKTTLIMIAFALFGSMPASALDDATTVPDLSPVPKFFQVGGGTFMIFGLNLASATGCYVGNPMASGACACPAGFWPYQMWSFNGSSKTDHYCQSAADKKCNASMYACYQ
jgi:hypothetical protein